MSTMIMARLLTPADFGIVAMAVMVRGLLDNLSRVGVAMLVIREPDSSREFYDTGWTMQILQGALVGAILVAIAPFAAAYFSEPRVVPVMRVLAVTALAAGFVNIGMVLVRKELDFSRDFRFLVYNRLFSFVFTIALAIRLRNYWAIVLGELLAQATSVALSFRMHGYRPRLSLVKGSSFLRFAASVLPYNLGLFLTGKADVLVVGRVAQAAYLGAYSVASELSSALTREVVTSVGRGLIPNYANLAADRARLGDAFLLVLSSTAVVCIALGMGLAMVAPEFITVTLGSQWLYAVPVLRWLAVYGILVGLVETLTGHILIVVGRERLSAGLMWLRLGLLVPFTVAASVAGGAELVAASATLSAALSLPVAVASLSRTIGISAWLVLSTLWRPTLAAAAMVAAVWSFPALISPTLVLLIGKTLVGGGVYVAALGILWWLAGRPDGIERLAARYLSRKGLRFRDAVG